MTRRKHPPPRADRDDFGFDVVGRDFTSTAAERLCLLGLDSLARDLYYTCLRPFCDRRGDVEAASYYRLINLLSPVQSPRGGRRLPAPTLKQLRYALDRLRDAGLITSYAASNMREGALQIRLTFGVRGISPPEVGAGVGPGSRRRAKPVLARLS